MSKPPPTLPVRLIRPASIELRFNDPKQYQQYIASYRKALGVTDVTPVTDSIYCLPVGIKPINAKTGDIELRFVLRRGHNTTTTRPPRVRTVVFWEVDSASLATTRKFLTKNFGYKAVDSSSSPLKGNSQRRSKRILLQAADSTEAFASRDGGGNSLGLVINPPYPRYTDTGSGGGGGEPAIPLEPPQPSRLPIGIALLVGLLLGWGFTRLVQYLNRR